MLISGNHSAPPALFRQHILAERKRLRGKRKARPGFFHALYPRGDFPFRGRKQRQYFIRVPVIRRPQYDRVRFDFHSFLFRFFRRTVCGYARNHTLSTLRLLLRVLIRQFVIKHVITHASRPLEKFPHQSRRIRLSVFFSHFFLLPRNRIAVQRNFPHRLD